MLALKKKTFVKETFSRNLYISPKIGFRINSGWLIEVVGPIDTNNKKMLKSKYVCVLGFMAGQPF